MDNKDAVKKISKGATRVFVIHEYGAPSHYRALEALCEMENMPHVVYHEFNLYTQFQQVLKGKYSFSKFLKNLFFFISLPFRRPCAIVIGIAPCNRALPVLLRLMKKHRVYYHTSYTVWDGTRMPHWTDSAALKEKWKYFISTYVNHIFAVSEKTKAELLNNGYTTADRITVVNHSYNIDINTPDYKRKDNSFIQVGNLIEDKGVRELLQYFSSHPDLNLTLVGRGDLEELVLEYSNKYHNINYLGYVCGLADLIPIYQNHCFLLQNSHRTEHWEELFGMAIMEGMACGCVPIATAHPGPKETIRDGIDGFLCAEGQIGGAIEKAAMMSQSEYDTIRRCAIDAGQSYSSSIIARRWRKVLE